MSDYHVDHQQADYILQGDTINFHAAVREDDAALGRAALTQGAYESAVRHLTAACLRSPDDAVVHYQLALALLGGRRPHLCPAHTIERVETILNGVLNRLPEAKALRVLVAEDYLMSWRRGGTMSNELWDLVYRVPAARAREIVRSVPARESLTWQALEARAEAGG